MILILILLLFLSLSYLQKMPKSKVKQGKIIYIKNGVFNPNVIIIKQGETVRWVNNDQRQYQLKDLTGKTIGEFKDPGKIVEKGDKFEYTFNEQGAYTYKDTITQRLVGTIIVE